MQWQDHAGYFNFLLKISARERGAAEPFRPSLYRLKSRTVCSDGHSPQTCLTAQYRETVPNFLFGGSSDKKTHCQLF